MLLKIKLIDTTMPVPAYKTKGAVAFDVYSRVDLVIEPWTPTVIPLNLVVKIPPGYFLMLAARSSSADKFGFIVANGVGVIDQDYCGNEDELGLKVLNYTTGPIHIHRGDRVGQALLVKIQTAEGFDVVTHMGSENRGGWGTTGHR